MPTYIIHKDGAFNMFSTVDNNPIFEPACTLEELREWYREEFGRKGLEDELPSRLERAIATGCSAMPGLEDLDYCIKYNHSGKNGKPLPRAEFIRRFLTIPV